MGNFCLGRFFPGPLIQHFPDGISIPSSTQAGRNSCLPKEKGTVRHASVFPLLPQGERLHRMSPEIFVVRSNQVQMVFSSSGIVLGKVSVVIY